MSIEFEAQGIEYAKRILADSPKRLRRAAANAVNRTIAHLGKEISVQVRKEYIVPAEEVKKALAVRRASRERLTGQISAKGSPLTLNVFKITRPKAGALRAKVRKSSSPKPVKGLFFGVAHKGYKGAMHRVGGGSYPLEVPYGPSVPQMVGNKAVTEPIEKEAEEYLNKRFLHEAEQQLRMKGR